MTTSRNLASLASKVDSTGVVGQTGGGTGQTSLPASSRTYRDSSTPEVSAAIGDTYYNFATRQKKIWNGTDWEQSDQRTTTTANVTAATYAAPNFCVLAVDTTLNACTITLPIPSAFSVSHVTIYDAGATATFGGFATNNCTVLRNGATIHGVADDVVITTKGVTVIFEYINTTWRLRNGG